MINYVKIIKNEILTKKIFLPNLKKIIFHTGIAKNKNKNKIKDIFDSIEYITGQKPIFSKSKKSISNFKCRKGDIVGIYVTLRKKNMWNFYNKLICIVIPKIKEFKGFNFNSLDRFGNFHFGISDCSLFPDFFSNLTFGANISIVLSNNNNVKYFFKLIDFPIE